MHSISKIIVHFTVLNNINCTVIVHFLQKTMKRQWYNLYNQIIMNTKICFFIDIVNSDIWIKPLKMYSLILKIKGKIAIFKYAKMGHEIEISVSKTTMKNSHIDKKRENDWWGNYRMAL